MVKYWWNALNVAVFNDILPPPGSVKFVQHEHEHAWAFGAQTGKKVNLSMQPVYESRRLFLTVLVHEMVHAWEYQAYGRMGHGKRFHSWQPRIFEATGLPLRKEY